MSGESARFDPRISAAIRQRDLVAFKDLLAAEPEQIHTFTPFAGGSWLHYAAREGDIKAVKHLLALGVDVNLGDAREGRTALCDAALGGHQNVAEALLEAGSRLDTSDPVVNPLFCAVVGRSLPIVSLLLSRGINAEIAYDGPSMRDMDAIAFALERGETAIAEEIARFRCNGAEAIIARLLEDGRKVASMNQHFNGD